MGALLLLALMAAPPAETAAASSAARPLVVVVQATSEAKLKRADAKRTEAAAAALLTALRAVRPDIGDAHGKRWLARTKKLRPADRRRAAALAAHDEGAVQAVTLHVAGKGRRRTLSAELLEVGTGQLVAHHDVTWRELDPAVFAAAAAAALTPKLQPVPAPPPPVTPAPPPLGAQVRAAAPAAGAPPELGAFPPPAKTADRAEGGAVPDEESFALWPWVTGAGTVLFVGAGLVALAAGGGLGWWALTDSNGYVADPTRTDLREASTLKAMGADGLYVAAAVLGGAGVVVLGSGLAWGLLLAE